jgi:hypothetical protein
MTGKICRLEEMMRRRNRVGPHNRHRLQNPNNRQTLRPFSSFPQTRQETRARAECSGCAGSRNSAKAKNAASSLEIRTIVTDTKTGKHRKAT